MKKKEDKNLVKYVIFSLSVTLLYTIVEFVFAVTTGITHDTLTTCVFATFGGELLMCALIKIFKLRKENDYE